MREADSPTSLLDELERRQDEVLEKLDQLAVQVETLLDQWQRAYRPGIEVAQAESANSPR